MRAIAAIDRFSEWIGAAEARLTAPLVIAVAWEVAARYVFAAPTVWSFDITYMLYGAMFMLGAAYALRVGAHIRTDFFWERWSWRTRGIIDSVAYLAFFFPGIALFLWVGWHEAWYAYEIGETSDGGRSCGRLRRPCRSPPRYCSCKASPSSRRACTPRSPAASSAIRHELRDRHRPRHARGHDRRHLPRLPD